MKSIVKPSTVDEYISQLPAEVKDAFEAFRAVILKAAPTAIEGIGYGMPALRGNKVILYYACFKSHYSLFGFPETNVEFKDRLKKYKVSKGTIQFQLDDKLPVKLITDIVKFRVKRDMERPLSMSKKKKA